jgi:hypothetical protein
VNRLPDDPTLDQVSAYCRQTPLELEAAGEENDAVDRRFRPQPDRRRRPLRHGHEVRLHAPSVPQHLFLVPTPIEIAGQLEGAVYHHEEIDVGCVVQLGPRPRPERDDADQRVASHDCGATGSRILELAKSAHARFISQDSNEQARLLRILLSNSAFDRGSLSVASSKPFDLLVRNWLVTAAA